MAPDAQILNYLFWLRQRGQVSPIPSKKIAGVEQKQPAPRKIRFLVVFDCAPATYSENQLLLVERMLGATGFPREEFVFETADQAQAAIAASTPEGVICLGAKALQAISASSFEEALTTLLPLSQKSPTVVCGIHTAEDMEHDPSLKRTTWHQLQRFIAMTKKEPRDDARGP